MYSFSTSDNAKRNEMSKSVRILEKGCCFDLYTAFTECPHTGYNCKLIALINGVWGLYALCQLSVEKAMSPLYTKCVHVPLEQCSNLVKHDWPLILFGYCDIFLMTCDSNQIVKCVCEWMNCPLSWVSSRSDREDFSLK